MSNVMPAPELSVDWLTFVSNGLAARPSNTIDRWFNVGSNMPPTAPPLHKRGQYIAQLSETFAVSLDTKTGNVNLTELLAIQPLEELDTSENRMRREKRRRRTRSDVPNEDFPHGSTWVAFEDARAICEEYNLCALLAPLLHYGAQTLASIAKQNNVSESRPIRGLGPTLLENVEHLQVENPTDDDSTAHAKIDSLHSDTSGVRSDHSTPSDQPPQESGGRTINAAPSNPTEELLTSSRISSMLSNDRNQDKQRQEAAARTHDENIENGRLTMPLTSIDTSQRSHLSQKFPRLTPEASPFGAYCVTEVSANDLWPNSPLGEM